MNNLLISFLHFCRLLPFSFYSEASQILLYLSRMSPSYYIPDGSSAYNSIIDTSLMRAVMSQILSNMRKRTKIAIQFCCFPTQHQWFCCCTRLYFHNCIIHPHFTDPNPAFLLMSISGYRLGPKQMQKE